MFAQFLVKKHNSEFARVRNSVSTEIGNAEFFAKKLLVFEEIPGEIPRVTRQNSDGSVGNDVNIATMWLIQFTVLHESHRRRPDSCQMYEEKTTKWPLATDIICVWLENN